MPTQVAVCGPGDCTEEDAANAHRVGELLAENGAVVICGGGSGVMATVAAGARAKNGTVIGVRADDTTAGASPDLSATSTAYGRELRDARHWFLSQRAVERFLGHMASQHERMMGLGKTWPGSNCP